MAIEADPRTAIGYVSVGLFSHAILRELFEVEDSNGEKTPEEAVFARAISSLNDYENPGSVKLRRPAFRSYQAVVTLCQVLELRPKGVDSARKLSEELSRIIDGSTVAEDRLRSAQMAIGFFTELAKRAAINTQAPHEDIPAEVRQLAQQRSPG